MKRFAFKLQAVLTLRQRTEQLALERYACAIQNRQAAADQLAATMLELSEARRIWLNAMADGCPAVRAAQMLAFTHSVEERRTQHEQAVHAADLELNQASQQMMLARQQREAVEHYLARLREQHERLVRAEERKLIDDLVGRRTPVSLAGRATSPTAWN
ncbi:MAG TPA: flagellar FliJ family protein [Candidatus Saccharimonadales bacterium]|jgi:flagellar export protein FliJ|nr:flagellar FliJ family protein [Candidatus Saccharimonadales bacterium]